MTYDDLVLHIKDFGRYQRRIYFLLCVPIITCAFHFMSGVFLSASTNYRCLQPNENPLNATYLLSPNLMALISSWDLSSKSKSPRCEKYDLNFIDRYNEGSKNDTLAIPIAKCDSFVYDKSTYQLTTTMEFDLICDKVWLKSLADSIFMFGVLIGAIIWGGLSDRYGRKPIYFMALVVNLVSGILVAVSPEYISYMIFRFMVAMSVTGIFSVAYVIAIEMVGPKKRLMGVIGIYLSFSSGYILTAGFAYFITNWRILQIAITVPSIAFLSYWWLIPESIRWLLNKGRIEEAKILIKKAASINGVELSEDKLDGALNDSGVKSPTEPTKKSSVFDLLRYPNLRRKSLLLFLSWFVISGTYYGLSWNTSNLGGNDYVNFLISAAVEVPAHIFVFFTLDRWGRRRVLSGCILFAGISLLLTTIVPNGMPWMVVCLAMAGKSAITGAFGSLYIFTSEQYPTTVRNVGLGSCSTFARIAGMLVPYINSLSTIWKPLPLVIFGLGSLIAGTSILLLPETLNQKLPETIEDGEEFGKDMKLFKTSTK